MHTKNMIHGFMEVLLVQRHTSKMHKNIKKVFNTKTSSAGLLDSISLNKMNELLAPPLGKKSQVDPFERNSISCKRLRWELAWTAWVRSIHDLPGGFLLMTLSLRDHLEVRFLWEVYKSKVEQQDFSESSGALRRRFHSLFVSAA